MIEITFFLLYTDTHQELNKVLCPCYHILKKKGSKFKIHCERKWDGVYTEENRQQKLRGLFDELGESVGISIWGKPLTQCNVPSVDCCLVCTPLCSFQRNFWDC